MRKIAKKLRSKKGETFVEVLLAVLVVAFGCLVIATLFGAAMTLNLKAKEKDEAYYRALTEAEQPSGDGEKFGIVITDEEGGTTNVEAERFGGDELWSYRK